MQKKVLFSIITSFLLVSGIIVIAESRTTGAKSPVTAEPAPTMTVLPTPDPTATPSPMPDPTETPTPMP